MQVNNFSAQNSFGLKVPPKTARTIKRMFVNSDDLLKKLKETGSPNSILIDVDKLSLLPKYGIEKTIPVRNFYRNVRLHIQDTEASMFTEAMDKAASNGCMKKIMSMLMKDYPNKIELISSLANSLSKTNKANRKSRIIEKLSQRKFLRKNLFEQTYRQQHPVLNALHIRPKYKPDMLDRFLDTLT